MTDKYAVIGNPVAHSKSPLIHAEFARQSGQDISYSALPAPLDGFKEVVLKFRDAGGKGVNVTVPFKQAAWYLVQAHSAYAMGAGAVNTIEFREERIVGHNTDGVGLVRDIKNNLQYEIKGKRVLLMGAGGASYGVMEPLLREQPEQLIVANRTMEKAISLVGHFEKFQSFAVRGISARPYDGLENAQFDIVINATSAGLSDAMPSLPGGVFASGAIAYDMVYGRRTPFVELARAQGARAADGTGMLVEQAAESFFLWRGVRPETAPVIAALRARSEQ